MTIRALAQDNFAERISHYVPAMKYAAAAVHMQPYRCSLGTPAVANTAGIMNDVACDTAANTHTPSSFVTTFDGTLDATFGRNITVTATLSADSVVTIHGRDYLGQFMQENITANGTSTVAGKKAFKHIDKVTTAAGTGGTTTDIGFGDVLGLPYKTVGVIAAFADDVVESAGTTVVAVTTDPQTATTGDPRGTYDPSTTLTGSVEIVVELRLSNQVNASNNGGLHGIAQYNG